MDFTNINDPAGVTALLEKLRASQAWAEIQSEPDRANPSATITPSISSQQEIAVTAPSQHLTASSSRADQKTNTASNTATITSSVANLLSQLSSGIPLTTPTNAHSAPYHSSSSTSLNSSGPSATPPITLPKKDVRNLSFQQSLSYLGQLSEDPAFLEIISKLRKDQEALERRLWKEREALCERQAEKVKTAVTKANMLNMGISQREAENMRQSFEKELQKFDKEEVLPAWDDLITKQQAALEKLGVPTMFVTNITSDKEKQQRIVSVIEGITGSEES